MKLNRQFEIAVRSLQILKQAEGAGYLTCEQLAKGVDSTVAFVEQTMRKLKVANLVLVKRGPGGGYAYLGVTSTFAVSQALGRDLTSNELVGSPSEIALKERLIAAYRETVV
jgi:hypothetical protein